MPDRKHITYEYHFEPVSNEEDWVLRIWNKYTDEILFARRVASINVVQKTLDDMNKEAAPKG